MIKGFWARLKAVTVKADDLMVLVRGQQSPRREQSWDEYSSAVGSRQQVRAEEGRLLGQIGGL